MTAPSPLQAAGSLDSFTITANGKVIDSMQVVSVQCWTEVNRLPGARLVFFDGSASEQNFDLSASDSFVPGVTLEIAAGYDGLNSTLFTGVVTKQSLEISENGAPRLIVEATDNSIKMTLARSNAIFESMTDSQIISKLIEASGLTAKVQSTSTQQPVVVQYYCSDWDLMLIRAGVNGMVVVASGNSVSVAPPDTGTSPTLTLTFGESIYELALTMDAETQYAASALTSYSWDMATLQVAQSSGASASVTEPGNLSSADLAKVFDIAAAPQQTAGFDSPDNLTAWASADLLKSMLAKIRGTVSFQGSALAQTGKTITLAGLGGRFNGTAYVSGTHHDITDGRWITTVTIGLSPDWFAATSPNIAAPGAAGLVAPIPGLQTGIVQKVSGDPDGEFRVYVTLPLLQASGNPGVWARLGSFYASNGIGAVFFPEVGDEVVVAFMNQDPRYPVIVGSVYSKGRPPPLPPDQDNTKKGIVTRTKLEVTFDEQNKVIQILTPAGQQVTLDDTGKSVTLKDCNSNSATLSASGITLDSASNMTLSAKGNIAVSADGNLALKAVQQATMEGMQVSHTAQTEFTASANTQTTLKSSGILTVQGSLVQIN